MLSSLMNNLWRIRDPISYILFIDNSDVSFQTEITFPFRINNWSNHRLTKPQLSFFFFFFLNNSEVWCKRLELTMNWNERVYTHAKIERSQQEQFSDNVIGMHFQRIKSFRMLNNSLFKAFYPLHLLF